MSGRLLLVMTNVDRYGTWRIFGWTHFYSDTLSLCYIYQENIVTFSSVKRLREPHPPQSPSENNRLSFVLWQWYIIGYIVMISLRPPIHSMRLTVGIREGMWTNVYRTHHVCDYPFIDNRMGSKLIFTLVLPSESKFE